MSTLFVEPYVIPSASFGEDNPLPDIGSAGDVHAAIPIDETTVSKEESQYMGWGRVNGILPYTIRDGYNRKKEPKAWKAVILENPYLRATFLPQLGGRLWSLIDRETGRELLHRNPVVQPCNLALRNAWISGGVEWNLGIIGHTPFTVNSLHAEALTLEDGTVALRMFQYERVRRLIYRVEVALPEDSRFLLIHTRIDNPLDEDTKVYWWSNIAVDEREDVRVVAPADRAFRYGYGGKLAKVEVPNYDQMDVSYTTQIPYAIDFFFDIPKDRRPFISALDKEGYGLVQTSTDVLRGRKLFVWGMNQGGRNWQRFLAEPGCAYLEIQAGLARTQLEHLPMKGGQIIQWTEAYGPLRADAEALSSPDYQKAVEAAERALEAALPRATMDQWDAHFAHALQNAEVKRIHRGDGWGYVDARMMEDAYQAGGLHFPPPVANSPEQEWLQLLESGALPCPDPLDTPKGYQIAEPWRKALTDSVASGKSDHWYGHYQLGVMYAYINEPKRARESFERSLSCAPSPWALRCLAVLAKREGDASTAADLMERAVDMKPQRQLSIEALRALLEAERYEKVLEVQSSLPAAIRALGRIKLMVAEALLALDRLPEAEDVLLGNVELTDVREGEVSLTDLWFKLCALKIAKAEGIPFDENLLARAKAQCPPPASLDFRMK